MNMSMEQLIVDLEEISSLLQRAQTNFKKCAKHRLTRGYIETRLSTVEMYWNRFTSAHNNLLRVVPKERKNEISYFANDEYFDIEEIYLSLKGDLQDLLSSVPSTPIDVLYCTGTTCQGQIKLAEIALPIFTGAYEEWPSFSSMFTSLVHNNTSLSKVQKLHYLKASVLGEASTLLRNIQVTENNYDRAWHVLKDRFGNKRMIMNSLLIKMFTQERIPKQTASDIKSLLNTMSECMNGLKNLNVTTDSWDPLMIFLVVQKLDPESHQEWEHYAYRDDDELPTWTTLIKFLETKYRTLDLIAPPSKEKDFKSDKDSFTVHYVSEESQFMKTTKRECAMCQKDHQLCHCREFTTMKPAERFMYVKGNSLCLNCLAPGHPARRCRLKKSCRICHKRHHSLVHQHMPWSPSKLNQPDSIKVHHYKVEESTRCTPVSDSNRLSSNLTTDVSTPVLATALVPVKDKYGHIRICYTLVDQKLLSTIISGNRPANKMKYAPSLGSANQNSQASESYNKHKIKKKYKIKSISLS